jgi:hypothetical protein
MITVNERETESIPKKLEAKASSTGRRNRRILDNAKAVRQMNKPISVNAKTG